MIYLISKHKLQKNSLPKKIRDQYFINGAAYLEAILNSIVFVLEAVVFEVTTTDTLYNIPVTNPVIVTGLLRLVDEILLVKAVVLSNTLISFVSIVTPLTGIATNLTSIFCEVPVTAYILVVPGSISMTTAPAAAKLGSTTTTGGGFGVTGVSPPLLHAKKLMLKTKIKKLYFIGVLLRFAD